MMTIKKLITGIAFIVCVGASAQQSWTLRQCIDYATKHNIDIRQQNLQIESSKIALNTSKNNRLPNLNASINQSFNFGNSEIAFGSYAAQNTSNASLSISSTTPLFTGFNLRNDIKVKEFNLLADVQGAEKAKQSLEIRITSYYLDVLFKQEILKVYADQEKLSQEQVTKTQDLVNAGKDPKSQLYDMKSQLASDQLNETSAKNDLAFSKLTLIQALNLPQTDTFNIVSPMLDEGAIISQNLSSLTPPDQIYNTAISIKPRVKEAQFRLESSKKNLKVAQSGYYPSLYFNIGTGNSIFHLYNYDNPPLSTQLKNNQSEYFGFSLNIPIFDRFSTRNQVRTARIVILNSELNLENIKLGLYKEIQQAYQGAVAAQAKYESTTKAVEAAQESFNYAKVRYNVGKSSVFEYNDAQTKLLSSKSQQLQAKYDFLFKMKILDFYDGKEININ